MRNMEWIGAPVLMSATCNNFWPPKLSNAVEKKEVVIKDNHHLFWGLSQS